MQIHLNDIADCPQTLENLEVLRVSGLLLTPINTDVTPFWGVAARKTHGTEVELLASYIRAGRLIAADLSASPYRAFEVQDEEDMQALTTVLGAPPVTRVGGYALWKQAKTDATRPTRWRVGHKHGKLLGKTKLLTVSDLAALASDLKQPHKAVSFAPARGPAPKAAPKTRLKKLLELQADLPALFEGLFPGCETAELPDGSYRISTGDMRNNVVASPRGKAGELMFYDHGVPALFEPGDALKVAASLGRPAPKPAAGASATPLARPKTTGEDKHRMARRVWKEADPLADDGSAPALAYLEGRGISRVSEDADLRFHPDVPMGDGVTLPALIAASRDAEGAVVAVQRIPLDGSDKKSHGSVKDGQGVWVRGLPGVGDELIVAEGVCTALAAANLFEAPAVATLGTKGMASFAVPEGVSKLLIAVDNDAPGRTAALRLAQRAVREGRQIRAVMPSEVGQDFADLAKAGSEAFEDMPIVRRKAVSEHDLTGEDAGSFGDGVFAKAFVDQHGKDVCFVKGGGWAYWSPEGWAPSDHPPYGEMGAVIRTYCVHHGDDPAKDIGRYDNHSHAAGAVRRAAKVLERDGWDEKPNLLALPLGQVLDLDTGDMRPVERGDQLLRKAKVLPDEHCEDWLKLLDELFGGDQSLVKYAQAIAVDCAVGEQGANIIALMHGPPGTGKSTVWNSVAHVLGGCATSIQSEHLLAGNGATHLAWLADLEGARMALTSEVPPGSMWNGPLVSQLTGGDPVKANLMRQNHRAFLPKLRLVVLCNDLPKIPTAESGLNRRMRVLPMKRVVDTFEAPGDTNIISFFKGEGAGQVLRWIADGARELAGKAPEDRYPDCEAVREATASYVKSSNDLKAWCNKALVKAPEWEFATEDAHTAYTQWATAKGKRLYTARSFSMELKKLMPDGCRSNHVGGGRRGYTGHRLAENVQ